MIKILIEGSSGKILCLKRIKTKTFRGSMNKFSPNNTAVFLLKTYFEDVKTGIRTNEYFPLKSMCQKFTPDNLAELGNEELATSWLVLFHLHFDKLGEDLSEATTNFENIFKGRSVKTIVLNHFISHCEVDTMEAKDFAFLDHVCEMYTVETIRPIGRKLALRWAVVFEKNLQNLNYKTAGAAFKAFDDEFFFRPAELTKNIVVKCLSTQHHLPLVLLLTYRTFQERMTPTTQVLRLEKTAIIVVEAFKYYLFYKALSKEALKMPLCVFVQLLDIARLEWIRDEKLKKLCFAHLEKVDSNHLESHLKLASLAVREGDEALNRRKIAARKGDEALNRREIKLAKQHFLDACEKRDDDSLSFAALGGIEMKNKTFNKAYIYFGKASEFAPFRYEYTIYQTQALVNYIKQFKKKSNEFLATSTILIKKLQLNEDIRVECSNFIGRLKGYFVKNNDFLKEFSFLRDLKIWGKLFQNNEFRQEHLYQISLRLEEIIEKLKNKLLFQATTLVDKFPKLSSQEMGHPLLNEQFLLHGEIFYEKGDLEGFGGICELIDNATKDNIIILSNKERGIFSIVLQNF